ncbi:uncharacterized protein PAE49_012192 isoform 2-T3 [Odontesthes bonariensis]
MMMMKMASVSTVSVFLLCFSVIESKGECNLYATKGKKFVMHLEQRKDSSDSLKWKFNNDVIFNRKAISQKQQFAENGSITLPSAVKADEGSYTYEVFDNNGKNKFTKEIHLCVLDPLKTPTVKKECKDQEVLLTCETPQKDVTYEWLQNNEVLPEKTHSLTKQFNEVKQQKFSCKVFKLIQSEPSEEVTVSCTSKKGDAGTDPSSSDTVDLTQGKGGFPDKLLGISIWIFVGGGAGIVLVLIIIVMICCIRAKRKRHMQLGDEEEFRLGWTNPEQQHRHHNHPPVPDHHHHHQQQSAGHTGPRQNRSRQQRPRAPEPNNDRPQPSPRRAAQAPRPANNVDDEQPPPLPQPRKKAPSAQKV